MTLVRNQKGQLQMVLGEAQEVILRSTDKMLAHTHLSGVLQLSAADVRALQNAGMGTHVIVAGDGSGIYVIRGVGP